jgi:hypothetical protein
MSLIVGHTSVISNVFAEISLSSGEIACSAVLRAIFRASLTQLLPVFCESVVTSRLPDPQGLSLLSLPLNFHLRASL